MPALDTTVAGAILNHDAENGRRLAGALVADQLPVGASLDGSWTCTPDTTNGEASCISGQPSGTTASGSGNLSQLVDIAVGGVLVFEIPVVYSDDPTVYP